RKESNYDRLKLELDDKKRLLSTILAKQSETGVSAQVKEKKATTIRIVDRGRKARAPFKPNLRQNVYYSFAVGLLIGIALVFGLEYLDRSFKNVDDVQRYVQLPFLGVVPRYAGESNGNGHQRSIVKSDDSERSASEGIDLLTVHHPESVASEAFRSVRTSLLLAFPEAPPRSILVTSSHPSEGKTFIAANMAISLAQLEKQVALVDGDMRNPRIHRIWGQQNNAGLSRYLTSDVNATQVITPSNIPGVSLITSGMKTPRPAELLASKRMDELLEELQDQFDHVIVDSPPVMLLADAVILASKCSCVLFVIQGGVTTRDVVQKAKQKLSAADAVMAGVVLNNVDLSDPYYYYSYYSRYGYDYKGSKKRARSKSA
ncbi:MAG TPA: polysaccharide biosynthesis tyrosine autokinase, partial [Acidobacteriota bacterium]|nr:polysaccharide biosynthesis tyrosine autokinase [Acidobacteriota bacterium]